MKKQIKSQSYKVTSFQRRPKKSLFLFLVFFFLFLLVTGDFCSADQIRIRTIITPVGSQSEKWGAAGLMVCIGGRAINVGGCGTSNVSNVNIKTSTGTELKTIEQQSGEKYYNKTIFFLDEDDSHSFGPGDTIYKVGGGGVGGMVEVRHSKDKKRVDGGESGTVDCSVDIPPGYVVIYAQKATDVKTISWSRGGPTSIGSDTAGQCENPSADRVCPQTNIGNVGPITISNHLDLSSKKMTTQIGACGIFAIAIQTN